MGIQSVADFAVDKIQRWIITGTYRPGEQLKEEEIAQRLEISRSPVREALKTLEAKGLVIRKPRQGVYVRIMTAKDTWEVYTVLASLLELAVGQAIDSLSSQDIKMLTTHLDQMKKSVEKSTQDRLRYREHHECFHQLILSKTDNVRLRSFASTLEFQVSRFNYHLMKNEKYVKTTIRYHQRILEAITSKKISLAGRLMKEHVLNAYKIFTENSYIEYY